MSYSSTRARPWSFAAVHRGVGVAQERLGRLHVAARQRDADARGDVHLAVDEHDRLGHRRADAIGDLGRDRLVGHALAEHGELVAAEPGDGVVRAHRVAQAVGDRPRADGRRRSGPRLSLITLKWSRSRNSTAVCPPLSIPDDSARRRRSTKNSRFGSPGERVVDGLMGETLAVAAAGGDVLDLVDDVHRDARGVADERRAAPRPTPRVRRCGGSAARAGSSRSRRRRAGRACASVSDRSSGWVSVRSETPSSSSSARPSIWARARFTRNS